MKNKQIKLITTFAVILAFSFAIVPTVGAQVLLHKASAKTVSKEGKAKAKNQVVKATSTTATSTKSVKSAKSVEDAIKKADTEIAKRIDSMNKTLDKVSGMKNVSDTDK